MPVSGILSRCCQSVMELHTCHNKSQHLVPSRQTTGPILDAFLTPHLTENFFQQWKPQLPPCPGDQREFACEWSPKGPVAFCDHCPFSVDFAQDLGHVLKSELFDEGQQRDVCYNLPHEAPCQHHHKVTPDVLITCGVNDFQVPDSIYFTTRFLPFATHLCWTADLFCGVGGEEINSLVLTTR